MATWRRILQPEIRKSDLSEEIEADLALAIADKCERGIDPETARSEVAREFGNIALVKDVTREMWGWLWLEQIQQDIASSLQQLRRSPGFAAAVITILAIGIGAATAMFTVVDGAVLRPLPFAHPDHLVSISEVRDTSAITFGIPAPVLQNWQNRYTSFGQFAYYLAPSKGDFLGSSQVDLMRVSSNFFQTLGVRPWRGHDFLGSNEQSHRPPNEAPLLLSYNAWKELYESDPSIVNKEVQLNGQPHFVVGVMPQGFIFPTASSSRPQVWTLLTMESIEQSARGWVPSYRVIARLAEGVSLSTAQREINAARQPFVQLVTESGPRRSLDKFSVLGLRDSLTSARLKQALMALLLAAGIFWLIACVNVTSLLFARNLTRQREIAMRSALGAGRWRLMQQAIIEGLLFSSAATAVGALLAAVSIRALHSIILSHLPMPIDFGLDMRVLSILVCLTFSTALTSCVIPALRSVHMPLWKVLKQGGQQGGSSYSQMRIRSALVVAEIGASVGLLLICGLLLRSIYSLRQVALGFDTNQLVIANLTIPSFQYSGRNMTSELYEPILAEAKRLPGVEDVGLMSQVPLGRSFNMIVTLSPEDVAQRPITATLKVVTPSIRRILGLRLIAGRFFNQEDTADSTPVVVVNRAFVRAYFPYEHGPQTVLGKQLPVSITRKRRAEIIGILGDERQSSLAEPSHPEIEVCVSQITPESGFYTQSEGKGMDLVMRTSRSAEDLAPELNSLLAKQSPGLANVPVLTMDQVLTNSYGSQQFATYLLEVFGGLAFFLCIGGLYGLLSYVVTQRTRDIGLRIAMGASRPRVMWMVLCQAVSLISAGIGIGIGLSLLFSRLLRVFLFGVSTHDLWTISSVALLFLAAGLLAAYLPARRAARIEPMEALRAE